MSITLVDKSKIAGLSVTVGELLNALNNKVFKNSPDDAPVLIHQSSGQGEDAQPLTTVFKCGSCDKLHLESGWYDTAMTVLSKKAIVYQDYRDREDLYIERKELISILSDINPEDKIVIMTTGDEHLTNLTLVLKCSIECPSVHLLAGYSNNIYNQN